MKNVTEILNDFNRLDDNWVYDLNFVKFHQNRPFWYEFCRIKASVKVLTILFDFLNGFDQDGKKNLQWFNDP